jgi:hypothetical protein
MKCEFKKVMDGISQFINVEIYSGLNDWQEFLARLMVGRILGNEEDVKEMLMGNAFIRSFGIFDSDGMVKVDDLAKDIKREIARKGKVSFDVPMFGNMTFCPSDVDKLYKHITGTEMPQ